MEDIHGMERQRTRAWRRRKNYTHARRKYNIAKKVFLISDESSLPALGHFRKGKVHCSCQTCAQKSNSKRNLGSEPKASDKRKPQMYPESP